MIHWQRNYQTPPPFVVGDPASEEALKNANISKAASLIAVKDDAANAFICLTAKNKA